jgi:hypothetical protein
MIIHKMWLKTVPYRYYSTGSVMSKLECTFEGWFLFGFIPIYIRTRG